MRITSDPRLIHSFLSTTPSSESFCVSIPDCRSFSSYFFPHYYCPSLRYASAGPRRWRLWWPLSVTALEKGEGSVKAEAVMRQSHGDAVYKFMSLSSHCFSPGHFDDDTHKHKLTHTLSLFLSGHVGTASQKTGHPVPHALTLLSNLTEYFSVFVSVNVCVHKCLFLSVCMWVCVRVCVCVSVCATLTLCYTRGTPAPLQPPFISSPLLNNLTPCRHYRDDRGRMFAPRDAMEKASRPHLTDGAKRAHTRSRTQRMIHRKANLYVGGRDI